MSAKKRVLFASPCQPIGGCSPNVYSWNRTGGLVSLGMTFINHPGLAFLEANVPGVETLPYPTWRDFEEALREPVDILGISFYLNESGLAIRMAELARQRGVREVWAGNYGGYSPQVEHHFDRIVRGWGEAETAAQLHTSPTFETGMTHPRMYAYLGASVTSCFSLHGLLFTSRGCPCACNFCQTPDFYGRPNTVSLEAIETVLDAYQAEGIASVNILDENFGIFPEHSRQVIRMLHRRGMRWIPLCRVDLLLKHFEEWREQGLYGVHIGVESLNPDSLQGANKRLDTAKTFEVLELLRRHNLLVQAFYIIGFEEDTPDSIRRDIRQLAKLDVDLPQIQVLTPYPRTSLRTLVEKKHGIVDSDLSKYNSRNLVWNHPAISIDEMKQLQTWANQQLFTPRRALRTLRKVFVFDCSSRLSMRGWARAGKSRERLCHLPAIQRGIEGSRRWLKRGWDAYEESHAIASPAQRQETLPHSLASRENVA